MSWIPCPSFCSISSVAAPGNNAQHPGTGWIWDSPSPCHCSKYLPAYSLSNEHYTLLTHPLFTSKSMCGSLEMKHEKRFLYKVLSKRVLSILARLIKKVLSKTRSAHICCQATEIIPSLSKEWPTAHWWISSRHFHSYLWLQKLRLLPSLSLDMFLGDPAALWIPIAAGGPSTSGHHPCSLHQAAELTPSFSAHSTHPFCKGKSKSLWAC